jgi:hypothetical protein
MTASFQAVLGPADAQLGRLAQLSGDLCHYSPAFLRARTDPRATLVQFTLESGGALVAGAVGYARSGRGGLLTRLTLPTQPVVAAEVGPAGAAELWVGVRTWCRAHRVATVSMHSFEGQALLEPPLGAVRTRTPRTEFVVDLGAPLERVLAGFSENHRRNIKKAAKQGVAVDLVTAPQGAADHAALFRSSMERRAARGEAVGLDLDTAGIQRLLDAGAGALAQARLAGRVVSSLLILSTATHAYYHSGGTAPEGMKVGASHGAMWHAMASLRERGVTAFCLGGVTAADSDGLAAFKLGFNPRRIALAHCSYEMDLPFPWSLVRRLVGR